MTSILTLFVIIIVSVLVTKIATVSLIETGLSKESARFQSRSAFTGVGFTTGEAERIVKHPVRRRIVMLLMLLGNAGLVSAVASLLTTFIHRQREGVPFPFRLSLLFVGLAVLWALANSRWFDAIMSRWIGRALKRWSALDTRDYMSLLHLTGDYQISELQVQNQDWLANRRLADLSLRDEGVVVIGIHREGGDFLGAPNGDTPIQPGDLLVLYGRGAVLEDLDQRRSDQSGDRDHRDKVKEQDEIIEKEKELE